jgi:hypothetical protein
MLITSLSFVICLITAVVLLLTYNESNLTISYEAMTKVDLMLIPLMCHVYVPFISIVMEIR